VDETTADNSTARTRRGLIGSLVAAGAAVAVASRASAAGDGTSPTTTAPPKRDEADTATVNALIAREQDMVATYEQAVGGAGGDDRAALELMHAHHIAYVQALAALLGPDSDVSAGQALALQGGTYAQAAQELAAHERATINRHVEALASIRGTDAANLVASIITVEARHVAALLVSATGTVQSLTAAGQN
jgi:hypothetical protein